MSSSLLLNHPTLADRARGAFYGLALSDAFGMPTQSLSRERIVEQFGRIDKLENAFPDQPIAPRCTSRAAISGSTRSGRESSRYPASPPSPG